MKVYKSLYPFEVMDAVLAKKMVRFLDKNTEEVYDANYVAVCRLAEAISSKEKGRYEFWSIEESEARNEQ